MSAIRFLSMLLPLATAVLVWSDGVGLGDVPLAAGQSDAPATDEPATGKQTNKQAKSSATKKSAAKRDSRGTEKRAAKAQRGPPAKSADGPGSPAAAPRKRSEAERKEAALALVRQHHPELVELLERLKATKQDDYQQAIKELYRHSQRLATLRERDADRYALELRAWQLDSRIRLLTAKLSLEDRAELEEELKACLAERAEVRLSLKKLERDRAAARAKKLDEEIEKLTAGKAAGVDRSFERLLRAAQRAAGNRRQGVKKTPGAKAADSAHAEAATGGSQSGQPQASDAKSGPPLP